MTNSGGSDLRYFSRNFQFFPSLHLPTNLDLEKDAEHLSNQVECCTILPSQFVYEQIGKTNFSGKKTSKCLVTIHFGWQFAFHNFRI